MVEFLPVLGVFLTMVGIIVSWIIHIRGNRPTATEVTRALQQRYSGDKKYVRGDAHVVAVIKSTVSNSDEWLNHYDYTEIIKGTAWLTGTFVGSAELLFKFHIPDKSPPIEKIKSHPYYGEQVEFADERAGTGPFEVRATEETLIINCGVYCQTATKGAAAVTGTLIVVSQIVDDIFTGKLESESEEIPPLSDMFRDDRLSDGEEPVKTFSELKESNLR